MRGGFLRGGLGQAVPQLPAVADLHASGQRRADGLPVCPGTVPADDLDPGVLAQPVLDDIGGAVLQDIDAAAGLGVDEDGRVDEAAFQGKVVNAQDAGALPSREG
jgi:hypothetical protein